MQLICKPFEALPLARVSSLATGRRDGPCAVLLPDEITEESNKKLDEPLVSHIS